MARNKNSIEKRGLIIAPGLDTYLANITIKKEKPSYIAFITDAATNDLVNDIIKEAKNLKIIESRRFFIKQYVSTAETIQEFFKAFDWLSKEKKVSEIIIDATNTLKPRALALYMTSSFIDIFKNFIGEKVSVKLDYVSCPFDLEGKPLIGEEKLIKLDEPTDTVGFILTIYAINLFNNFDYASAAKIFDGLEEKASGNQYLLYSGLKKLTKGFEMWDSFQLNRAIEEMEEAFKILGKIKGNHFVKKLLPQLKKKIAVLKTTNKEFGLHQIVDLFQNANRRLEKEKLDDAVARFYCCLEMMSRYRLRKYGISASKPDFSKLPESVVEKFRKGTGNILPREIDLKKGFELLKHLDDFLGKEAEKIGHTFTGLIGMRNFSILAHGNKPVTKENTILFKEKLVERLLFALLDKEGINKDNILNSHLHIKLPITIKEFYKQS